MRNNIQYSGPIRDVLRMGGRARCGWCTIPSTIICEIVARQDFDCIAVDLQHGLIGFNDAVQMIQVINARTDHVLARIPWNEPAIVMKLLDAGYLGIICPMVNNRHDAEALVQNCAYPPLGRRSFGPIRAKHKYKTTEYRDVVNDIVIIAMIETLEGLANAREIIATQGIHGVYIGPSDLSLAFGLEPSLKPTEPKLIAAIEEIRAAAAASNKFVGIACDSGQLAAARFREGFDMATIGTDAAILEEALASGLKAAVANK